MSEVRLIDANALEELFEEECTGECSVCGYSNEGCPCGLIKTAPTVTPDMAQVLAYECGKASAERPTDGRVVPDVLQGWKYQEAEND